VDCGGGVVGSDVHADFASMIQAVKAPSATMSSIPIRQQEPDNGARKVEVPGFRGNTYGNLKTYACN
jgi:hypothetical protein